MGTRTRQRRRGLQRSEIGLALRRILRRIENCLDDGERVALLNGNRAKVVELLSDFASRPILRYVSKSTSKLHRKSSAWAGMRNAPRQSRPLPESAYAVRAVSEIRADFNRISSQTPSPRRRAIIGPPHRPVLLSNITRRYESAFLSERLKSF